jgi:hypothetical protein
MWKQLQDKAHLYPARNTWSLDKLDHGCAIMIQSRGGVLSNQYSVIIIITIIVIIIIIITIIVDRHITMFTIITIITIT